MKDAKNVKMWRLWRQVETVKHVKNVKKKHETNEKHEKHATNEKHEKSGRNAEDGQDAENETNDTSLNDTRYEIRSGCKIGSSRPTEGGRGHSNNGYDNKANNDAMMRLAVRMMAIMATPTTAAGMKVTINNILTTRVIMNMKLVRYVMSSMIMCCSRSPCPMAEHGTGCGWNGPRTRPWRQTMNVQPQTRAHRGRVGESLQGIARTAISVVLPAASFEMSSHRNPTRRERLWASFLARRSD